MDNLKASWSKGFSLGGQDLTLACEYDRNANSGGLSEATVSGEMNDISYSVNQDVNTKKTIADSLVRLATAKNQAGSGNGAGGAAQQTAAMAAGYGCATRLGATAVANFTMLQGRHSNLSGRATNRLL